MRHELQLNWLDQIIHATTKATANKQWNENAIRFTMKLNGNWTSYKKYIYKIMMEAKTLCQQ